MSHDGLQPETSEADLLRCMVRDGNRGAVKRLILKHILEGVEVFADAGGERPLLSLAARKGHKDVVEFLLEQEADVNEKGPGSETALHAAVAKGHSEIASILMKHGADVRAIKYNGSTVLHLAARLGLRDTVGELLDQKVDVNAHDGDLWTPLHEAARYGHFEVAVALIEAGATVDAARRDQFTPLHSAARYGHGRIALALIQHGADVNAVRIEGWTPLLSAVHNHHTELAKDLIERGANVNDKNYASCTALHLAATHGHVDLVSTLIQYGAKLNAIQYEGRTPLHLAANNNHVEIISLLIAKGAQIDVLDKTKGWTALNVAILYGHVKSVEELLKSGARSDIKCNAGNTPLHSAVEKNRLEVMEKILEQGCAHDLNVCNTIGLTPLHHACLVGSEEMVKRLIKAGARVDIKDDSGRKSMDFAKLKPEVLRNRLENAFRRLESDSRGLEGRSERDIDLASGQEAAAGARESTPESSTGHSTGKGTQGTSSLSSASDEWSPCTPFGSKKSMLRRIDNLARDGYTFYDQYQLQPGCVDTKTHIRFVSDVYGNRAILIVKFFHQEARFKNAKQIYDATAGSDFICNMVRPLNTNKTGEPSGIVLTKGKFTLTRWLELQQRSFVDKRWCLHQVLNGIKELHLLGIVHTNLVPSRIMFFSEFVWKLIGLDRARMAGTEAVMAATPSYAAPELLRRFNQALPSLVTQPSLDLWSFGVIAYEVISGNSLFGDVTDASSIADEIDNGKIRSRLGEIQDSSQRELLTNLLEIDPTDRCTVDDALQSDYFRDDARTTTSVWGRLSAENSD